MNKIFGSFIIVYVFLALFTLASWVTNLIKLTQCDFEPSYKAEVVHSVGTVIPVVGAVAGWLDLGK